MTNNLVTTVNGVTVGDIINNPDVGEFVVVAINANQNRTLLMATNPNAFNRYIGAWGLTERANGTFYWNQGHYHGGDLQSATEYVLGIENQKKRIYVVIGTVEREIYKIGASTNPNEASEILKNDFMSCFYDNGYTDEEFTKEVGKGDEWDLSATEAWINRGDGNDLDWQIIEVEV